MTCIEKPTYRGGTEVLVCNTKALHPQARFAEELMRHLAIAACVPDGEDSSGRQKVRLATPEEVVIRATRIAELAWEHFGTRKWILEVPVPKIGEP